MLFSMKYAIAPCKDIAVPRLRKTAAVMTGYAGNIPYPYSCATETVALSLHYCRAIIVRKYAGRTTFVHDDVLVKAHHDFGNVICAGLSRCLLA